MSSARIIDNGYRSDSFFIAISIEFCNIVIEKPSFAVLYEGRRALKRLRTTVFFPRPRFHHAASRLTSSCQHNAIAIQARVRPYIMYIVVSLSFRRRDDYDDDDVAVSSRRKKKTLEIADRDRFFIITISIRERKKEK